MGEVMKATGTGALDKVGELFRRASESMHASRSFGEPVEAHGVTVIPVAYVLGGGGGGGKDTGNQNESGGGFGFVSIPMGAYVISNGEVRWRPTLDAGLATIFAFDLVRRLLKRRQR